ncbi:MAG: hypothetical protein HFH74_06580 [Lachnospiraceae bacterium]|jgi:hypothetical protein|nr:hypothetical protein [Lachnospiraceae bacterium]
MKRIMKLTTIIGFVSISSMLFFGRDVNAYIDPSVMTYVIQAVAGIVVALGAGLGLYIRKVKKKVNDKLGIDENRNKEVESDEIIVSDTNVK